MCLCNLSLLRKLYCMSTGRTFLRSYWSCNWQRFIFSIITYMFRNKFSQNCLIIVYLIYYTLAQIEIQHLGSAKSVSLWDSPILFIKIYQFQQQVCNGQLSLSYYLILIYCSIRALIWLVCFCVLLKMSAVVSAVLS